MQIRLLRETRPGERRVALTPRGAAALVAKGHQVLVTPDAGLAAGFPDAQYVAAGAEIAGDPPTKVDLVVGVGPLTLDDLGPTGAAIGFLDPLGAPAEVERIARAGITAIAMELIPRTTLAQSMDALSSQATVAGYEAVLLGASSLPRMFPMLMTAAGTIRPSKVLVLGAGVAGLQAIATAKRLGAVVSGYDIRPAAREQIESLGAKFVGGPTALEAEQAGGYATEVDEATRQAQQEALAAAVAESDVVITAAQVPGRKAPILVTRAMVDSMSPGSVVVDTAASTGGNCEVTRPGEIVLHGSVTVHGPLDLASRSAGDASEMYSRNVTSLLGHLVKEDVLTLDPADEIAGACVARGGQIVDNRVRAAAGGAT
ncbi:MAG: NAD(P) transhydrogenase subunit alpha [Acidimicrobiia bacterium]